MNLSVIEIDIVDFGLNLSKNNIVVEIFLDKLDQTVWGDQVLPIQRIGHNGQTVLDPFDVISLQVSNFSLLEKNI